VQYCDGCSISCVASIDGQGGASSGLKVGIGIFRIVLVWLAVYIHSLRMYILVVKVTMIKDYSLV